MALNPGSDEHGTTTVSLSFTTMYFAQSELRLSLGGSGVDYQT